MVTWKFNSRYSAEIEPLNYCTTPKIVITVTKRGIDVAVRRSESEVGQSFKSSNENIHAMCHTLAFLIAINIGAALVFSKTFLSICLISIELKFMIHTLRPNLLLRRI